MERWKKVFSTDNPIRAELVKGVLEQEGMPVILLDKRDSSYNNFGEKEIYVDQEHVLLAIKIIQHDLSFR
jgi:hypothetical protein